ncbi:hypothetical protein [Paenibacillus apiarius]
MKQIRAEGVRWRDLTIALESESSPYHLNIAIRALSPAIARAIV